MKVSKYITLLTFSVLLIGMSACEERDNMSPGTGSLQFYGDVEELTDASTRGPETNTLSRKDFDLDFYLALKTGDTRKCNLYRVPEDRPGFLRSFQTADSLMWQSVYSDHYFYGWTMPWVEKDPYMTNFEDRTPISFVPEAEMYNPRTESGETETNIYNSSLEKFIGAGKGPLTYSKDGEYVNMNFRHLVSKITIETFRYTFVDPQGNLQTPNVDGTLTLIGMPEDGFFIREGEYGPHVIGNEESNQVTYNISKGTVLYVCPNIDFSKLSFRITSSNQNIQSAGDFLGDFSTMTFDRNYNDNWVLTQMEEHPDTDPATTLYAGENLILRITIRQTVGNYVAASIGSWDYQGVREGGAYPYPGIYTGNEMQTFYNQFADGYDPDEEDRMFKNYGDKDHGEYRLYDDMNDVVYGFRFGRKYVMNGMGHTITFGKTRGNENGNSQIRISKCYDVYLADSFGNTFYIDKYFNVFRVNDDGSMTQTGHLDDLPDDKGCYIINLANGDISFGNGT